MTRARNFCPSVKHIAKFGRDDRGGVLVEFGLVISFFFLLMYVALDFGRMAYTRVLGQKAVELALRTTVVRPAACAGLPDTHVRGPVPNGTIPPRFGTSCSAAADVCASVATVTCSGVATNPTAAEIWNRVSPLLPPGSTVANLEFSYSFDSNLGFLGGPYTPVVSVELNLANFQFITPLGPLFTGSGASPAGAPAQSVPWMSFSMSLPAEDLNAGDAG